MRIHRASWMGLAIVSASPLSVSAQIRASEPGSVSQTIDGTRINIEYSRPRARGRDPLFGKVVRWGEVWTPGANYATTIEVSKDIRLDGHPLPRGKYSVWMVVRDGAPWTLVLDPDFHRYHMEPPDSNPKQIRFPVRTSSAPFEEALSWRFSDLEVSGATLGMYWGSTRVAMKVEVTPSLRLKTPAAEAAPFLGRYDWVWKGPDSTRKVRLVTTYEDGWLIGNFEPKDDYFDHFALIRIADGWYTIGLFEQGKIYEVVREWVISFKAGPGGAVTLELRDDSDALLATGTRQP